MNKAEKAIQAHLDAAYDLAIKEIEARVRVVLKRSPKLSFCMAMGSAFFTFDGQILELEDRAYFAPVMRIIDQYDNALKLTGTPMKISGPNAPLVTDW